MLDQFLEIFEPLVSPILSFFGILLGFVLLFVVFKLFIKSINKIK